MLPPTTDPNTEWKDIRSALRARTRGGLGCSTNLAMINASCTGGGGGPDGGKHSNNPMLAAAELIKLQVEADEGNRRASVESWNSNRRPSRRASRRASTASRRRSSLRWSGRSSVNSLQSSFNFNDSVTSKDSVNMMDFGDSVNMMDFGVSQRLAVLDESRRELLLDESRRNRSCASLDGLDELKEEMEFHNYNEGGGGECGESLDGSIRSEGDFDDYVDDYGFLAWPSTPREEEVSGGNGRKTVAVVTETILDDPSSEEGSRRSSHVSQESSSTNSTNLRSSRRASRRASRRRSSRRGSIRRSSTSSIGSSFNFSDSLISESGFMAWPSAAQEEEEEEEAGDLNEIEDGANATIQEELADQVKREEEEWHIEDYEKDTDDSGHNERCVSEGSSVTTAFANTFKMFARPRRASNEKSAPSQDSQTDLTKIKETLLNAKNKQQGVEEVEENAGKKKREGSMSLLGMFQQSMEGEVNVVKKEKEKGGSMPLASMFDASSERALGKSLGSSEEEPTRRRSREQAIFMRHNSTIDDDPDVYKKLYAQGPNEASLRQSLNIFGRPKSNNFLESRRGSS
eukprot:scaffold11772_cov183-Skeletonema_marinoi.AAC.6